MPASSYSNVSRPLFLDLSTPPIHIKLELFFELVIKTRQSATEVTCLGYRRAAGVKGHVGFESLSVGRDLPQMNRGIGSM